VETDGKAEKNALRISRWTDATNHELLYLPAVLIANHRVQNCELLKAQR